MKENRHSVGSWRSIRTPEQKQHNIFETNSILIINYLLCNKGNHKCNNKPVKMSAMCLKWGSAAPHSL